MLYVGWENPKARRVGGIPTSKTTEVKTLYANDF